MAFGAPVPGDAMAVSLYERVREKFRKRPHPYPELPENVLKFRNVMMNYQAQLRLLVAEIANRKANHKYTIIDITSKDISDVLGTSYELVKSQVRGIEKKSAQLAAAIQPMTGKDYNVFQKWASRDAERLSAISTLSENKIYNITGDYTDEDMLQSIREMLGFDLPQSRAPINEPVSWSNAAPVPVVKWSLQEKDSKFLFDALETAMEVLDHHFANYSRLTFDYTQKAVMAFWPLDNSETNIDYINNDYEPIIGLENPTIASQTTSKEERVLGHFARTEVKKHDICSKGQYRGEHPDDLAVLCSDKSISGICRLSISFQNEPPTIIFIGTGWLVNPSTIVTAGHNLYDIKKKSHATRIKVTVGLKGKPPATDTGLEEQYASSATVHWAYYDRSRRCNDFGIVRLHTPFKDIQPILWQDAPPSSKGEQCKVVGYPGDLPSLTDRERGYIMYEAVGPVKDYDCIGNEHQLEYWPDTFGGNSGSPVLIEKADNTIYSIGVHAYGSTINQASTIGHQGNSIKAFIEGVTFQENTTGSGIQHADSCESYDVVGKVHGLKRIEVSLK